MVDWEKLEKVMLRLGFDEALLGTGYIREAVGIWDDSPHCSLTKELYPEVARQFGTTPTRAERAMRHAIETASLRGSQREWDEIFGFSIDPEKGRPVNGSLIARLARVCRIWA